MYNYLFNADIYYLNKFDIHLIADILIHDNNMGCTKSKLDNLTFDKTPTFTLEGKKTKVKILKIYDGDTLWLAVNLKGNFYKFKGFV